MLRDAIVSAQRNRKNLSQLLKLMCPSEALTNLFAYVNPYENVSFGQTQTFIIRIMLSDKKNTNLRLSHFILIVKLLFFLYV